MDTRTVSLQVLQQHHQALYLLTIKGTKITNKLQLKDTTCAAVQAVVEEDGKEHAFNLETTFWKTRKAYYYSKHVLHETASERGRCDCLSSNKTCLIRFACRSSDLKAVSSVFAVYSHNRTVVQVLNQSSSYCSPWLTHQVATLSEEIESFPSCSHQTCFTKKKMQW